MPCAALIKSERKFLATRMHFSLGRINYLDSRFHVDILNHSSMIWFGCKSGILMGQIFSKETVRATRFGSIQIRSFCTPADLDAFEFDAGFSTGKGKKSLFTGRESIKRQASRPKPTLYWPYPATSISSDMQFWPVPNPAKGGPNWDPGS